MAIAARNERPLLIICDGMEGNALSTVVVNSVRGVVQSCVVEAPAYGEVRKDYLRDIATLTGGKFIDTDESMNITNISEDLLGSCSSIKIGPNSTVLIEGNGDRDAIQTRAASLRKSIELEKSPYEQKKLKERLGKIDGGAAVIKVGASSSIELKEKRDRIDDALGAAKAAIIEGVIPGAGFTGLRIGEWVDRSSTIGTKILSKALKKPCYQILINAGLEPHVILTGEPEDPTLNVYNSLTEEWVNPWDGLLDPSKVLRLAIQNAVSVASMILTTECLIYSDEEPDEEQAR